MKKLLLHVCCGPCVIYPIKFLKAKGLNIYAFFYNPNIQPKKEYNRRLAVLKKYLDKNNIKLIIPKYNQDEHLNIIKNYEKLPSKRCPRCWDLRLDAAAKYAVNNDYDFFTSTLLISPHQDISKISKISEIIAKKYNISFYNPGKKGFRSGFADSRKTARSEKMYCQDYCGCIFSKLERD